MRDDEIRDLVYMDGGDLAVCFDKESDYFGWIFVRTRHGRLMSGRPAYHHEMQRAARYVAARRRYRQ